MLSNKNTIFMKHIGIDIGGTNGRTGEVNPETGEVKSLKKFSTKQANTNKELTEIIQSTLPSPKNCELGISTAGVIDEELVIRLCPNIKLNEQEVTFAKTLKERGYKIKICNDLKAAAHGEAKYGNGREHKNIAVATYSSGHNAHVMRNGKSIGDPEFGHAPYLRINPFATTPSAIAQQYFLITPPREHILLQKALEKYIYRRGERKLELDELKSPKARAIAITYLSHIQQMNEKELSDLCSKNPGEPQETILQYLKNENLKPLFCGCGRKCIEPWVAGNGAATMAQQHLLRLNSKEHLILKYAQYDLNQQNYENGKPMLENLNPIEDYAQAIAAITAEHVYKAYRANPDQEPQKTIRQLQVEAIADSFLTMQSMYNPLDVIVCMGSQTNDWDILFEPAIEIYRAKRITCQQEPKIVKTKLEEIGVQGAVAYLTSKE